MGVREFQKPLAERLLDAERMNRRYRTDPDFRLRRINRARQQAGLAPRASLAECDLRLPMEFPE